MSDYIRELMKQVREAVMELYSGSMVNSEVTENWFFCDFDMAEPLNPGRLEELRRWSRDKRSPNRGRDAETGTAVKSVVLAIHICANNEKGDVRPNGGLSPF